MPTEHTTRRILIAGASGTIGMPLARALAGDGDAVIAVTRSGRRTAELRALGASVVVADALDRDALVRAVVEARPTHVVHQLTALPKAGVSRPSDLEATNRLRIDGTRNLIDGAVRAGARRFLAGSFALLSPRERGGPPVEPPAAAVHSMESQVLEASARGAIEGVVLRYGLFYGIDVPSTVQMIEQVRRHRLPAVRGDAGQLPFIHIDDAVAATVNALDRAPAGSSYNIVDDAAVSFSAMLDTIAEYTGASAPWRVPAWIPRLVAPYMARLIATRLPLSNAAAKAELGWRLRYPTIQQGLAALRRAA